MRSRVFMKIKHIFSGSRRGRRRSSSESGCNDMVEVLHVSIDV